ncbi:vacuolar protein sorting-associated protein 45 [Clydaea vesicula]|uniref:Vacuolar protein sorting-associated protein 45 n=1 Tax=Clydaea vesicula TaxID=447962 RepID=A0AAD5U3T9_9FUNG|nr:vacuolar protein sorting-associated protein 45 [Clydaea vesicula]
MDCLKSVQNYLSKMVSEVNGMKVLLLDQDTTPIISVAVTQTTLLAKEVYLIDRIDNRSRDKMKHLKCICFCRPTPESIQAIVEELRQPNYGEYYLYFSNTLKKSQIERLAEVDEFECVREVQEYFSDFLAINPELFSLNLNSSKNSIFIENSSTWDNKSYDRCSEGIIAILLALKRKPLIRYERNSIIGRKLATEVNYQIQQELPLFEFRKMDTPPILLILDRRNDPVTPLLNQWTYQAMVHELLGINNSRVDLSNVPGIRPEMKEVVLSIDHDQFYKKNMFLNFGELGSNIKEYLDEYQLKHKSSMNIESIDDMKKFMEDYPEFRKLSGNVTKHVALVGELSRIIEKEMLLEVSELEQSLACSESHTQDLKTLKNLLERSSLSDDHKIRLTLLYALHYEKSTNNFTNGLVDLLTRNRVDPNKILMINEILKYANSENRQEDLFANEDVLSRTKNVFKGLKGVENVYTQHVPQLIKILESLVKGKLKDSTYPFVEGNSKDRPQDVIVFMIGGATYAEAREVEKFNRMYQGVRVVLGGTFIHNSKRYVENITIHLRNIAFSFLSEVHDAVNKWSAPKEENNNNNEFNSKLQRDNNRPVRSNKLENF